MIGRTNIIDPARQFYSGYLWVGNNPISGIDPTGGVCDNCPKGDANYDAYRNDDAIFNYEDGVGAYYDIGEFTIIGSSAYPVHESFSIPSYQNQHAAGFFEEMAVNELRKVEALMATGELIMNVTEGMSFMTGGGGQSASYVPKLGAPSGYLKGVAVGWGQGTPVLKAAQQTITMTKTLTRAEVEGMKRMGLTKEWVIKQLDSYSRAIAKAEKGGEQIAKNPNLLPRKALMEKIIKLW